MSQRDQYPVRKLQLGQEDESDLAALSPSARVAMVWQLTVQAWAFKEGRWIEPRLRRDVVRRISLESKRLESKWPDLKK